MHECLKFTLFWNNSICFGGLSVHHQELKIYIQQHAYVKQILLLLSSKQTQADSSICLTYACCCMHSRELLMMDGKTVRNMYSYSKIKKISDIGASGWFYYRNILRCTAL